MTHAKLTDFERSQMRGMAADIFETILGEPTVRTKSDTRWAAKGSLRLMPSGVVYDFSEGQSYDPIDLLMQRNGFSFVEALSWVRRFLVGVDVPSTGAKAIREIEPPKVWPDYCQRIWEGGRMLTDEAIAYFRDARGITDFEIISRAESTNLCWHPVRKQVMALMVMPDGEPSTVLTLNIGDGSKGFIKGCLKKGTAAMIKGGRAKQKTALICEGVVTGLSFLEVNGGTPASTDLWACGDCDNLRRWNHTHTTGATYDRIIICGDNDENGVGLRAANDLKDRMMALDIPTEIMVPESVGDWNDVLMAKKGGQHATP